jgi:hypothetical protein
MPSIKFVALTIPTKTRTAIAPIKKSGRSVEFQEPKARATAAIAIVA